MNEYDLFDAIGGAEDGFLEELEQCKILRLPKHFGLIAAMLALLLTACAAPVVIRSFDKLQEGSRAETGSGYYYKEYSPGAGAAGEWQFQPTGLEVTVEVDPGAPRVIEEYGLPLEFLEYFQVEICTATDTEFLLGLSIEAQEHGRIYGASYKQYALPEDGKIQIEDVFSAPDVWEQSFRNYGDVEVMEVFGKGAYRNSEEENDPNFIGGGSVFMDTRQIFWSDGFYLYALKIPLTYSLRNIDIGEIITGLTAVEDIEEYLTTPEP